MADFPYRIFFGRISGRLAENFMNHQERAELEADYERLVVRFLETDSGEDLQLISLIGFLLAMSEGEQEKAA